MNKLFIAFLLLVQGYCLQAQSTFKCGWTSYKTAMIVHEYTYSYTYSDSFRLYLADSTKTFIAPDSAATLMISYPFRDNNRYQIASYYNPKKKLIKTEDYKDNLVQVTKEYKYDDKNRKIYQHEDNRLNSNSFKKTYDYSTDKNGDFIVSEISYFNGRVEFYTKTYYDKNGVRYKEIRLNDNNKDVVHVENFYYNAAGKLKERTVFFPEFKVTKKFQEQGGDAPAKCYKAQVVNIPDKVTLGTKISYLKKLLYRNNAALLDPECREFEYRFFSSDCEVIIGTTKINNVKQVIFRFKERVNG